MSSLLNYSSYLKTLLFVTQLIIWCVSNNVLKNNNACPRESWCSSLLKTRSSYLDLAFKLACFWKFLFSYYFNQGNVSASKTCCCKQHFQWKYPQKSFLGNFLDATLFFNMTMNLFWWQHLEMSSVFWFIKFSPSYSAISSLSFICTLWYLIIGGVV